MATTTSIGKGKDVLTVIFEFNIKPEQQEDVSSMIQKLVGEIVRHVPGFICSHLHVSTDGEKVLNYFQWESKEAFDKFRQDEDKQQHIRPLITKYSPKPRMYEIVSSFTAG